VSSHLFQADNNDDDTRFPSRIRLLPVLEMRSIVVCPQISSAAFSRLLFYRALPPLVRLSDLICGQIVFTMTACDRDRNRDRGDIDFFIKLYGLRVFCRSPSCERFTLAPPLFPPESFAMNSHLLRCIGSG